MSRFERILEDRLDAKEISPGQWQANCPFCVERGEPRPDSRARLGISLKSSMTAVHCFNCGYSGTPARLLRDLGMKVSLAHLPKEEEPKEIQELERIKEEDLPGIPLAKKKTHISAWRYLKSRGITNQMIEQYQIRYDLIGDYQGRVIIPIRYRGDLVGFQGRAIQDIHPKYRFGEGFQASRVLFNYDRAIESDLVIIMEGIFDVFSSPENSVAVFTNRLSDAQRFLIIQAGWKEAIVMLDRDEMDSSRKIRKQLSPFLPTKVARIQTKDPGEATPDQIREAIRTAGSGLSIL